MTHLQFVGDRFSQLMQLQAYLTLQGANGATVGSP